MALGTAVMIAVEDSFGNVVTSDNSAVTLSVASRPGGFDGASTVSVNAVNGIATFSNLILDTSGKHTLNATDGSLAVPTSGTITITPAAAAQLVLQQTPSTGTAGVALAPAVNVAVEDHFGNLVTSATAVALTLSSGTFSTGKTTATDNTTAGVATFSTLTINTAGSYTLTASTASISGPSFGVAIAAAAASSWCFCNSRRCKRMAWPSTQR